MKVTATFITSGAGAADFPRDGLLEVALVGRSNVGKSSLINASVRQKIARTSAAPGKTRLANVYRVAREGRRPLYLVDLPGFGYSRGGSGLFAQLIGDYFRSACGHADAVAERSRGEASALVRAGGGAPAPVKRVSALLLVDSRHPGLESDLEAWAWLRDKVDSAAIVATKIDKLARGERIRRLRQFESVFEHPVLPVSAVTGEGLDELWTLIDRMATNPSRPSPPNRQEPGRSSPRRLPRATAARPPRKAPRPPKN